MSLKNKVLYQTKFENYVVVFVKIQTAAARRALTELIGSEGSRAEMGIPAAWAAAMIAALLAAAAAEDIVDEGRDRDFLGGTVIGDPFI